MSRLVSLLLVRINAINELANTFSRIHKLSQLETLNFTFNPVYDSSCVDSDYNGRVSLQVSILSALAVGFAFCAPPKLASLSLHNLRVWRLPFLESHSFHTCFTTLRRLRLSVLSHMTPFSIGFTSRWTHFWGNLPQTILALAQHTLTKLTLHSETHVDASTGLTFTGLHFPHLCALSFCKFVFEPSTSFEPFTLRHAATLAQLELLSCKLSFVGGAVLFQSSSTSSTLQGWTHIWNRFEAELTALVALHVDNPEYHFVTHYPSKSRRAADAAALQRFHTTVTVRSENMCGEA
jgi:hypothetical protein